MKIDTALLTVAFFAVLMCGCSLFKTERKDIPPPPPKLDSREEERVKEQASINYQLADKINKEGATANSIATITLRNGTKIVLDYVGHPYEDPDIVTLTPKQINRIAERAKDIVQEHNEDLAKYDQKMGERREDLINETNLKWDWKKIFGFGISTWVLLAIGIPILIMFFPVLLPVFQLLFQLFSAGIGAFGAIAKLGVKGVTRVVGSIEEFRDKNKGTEVGSAFDEHMKKSLSPEQKEALDKFKNYFKI
jgi:hypothetical protein